MGAASKNYNDFKDILDGLDLVYKELQENQIVVPFGGDDSSEVYVTDLVITIDDEYYIIEAAFPTNVPIERVTEVSFYLHLVNSRLKMGKFIIDLKSGNKSGKVAFSSAGLFETTEDQVWKMLGVTLNMAEQQIKPIYSIGFGEKNPIDVYDEFFSQILTEDTVENAKETVEN